MAENSSYLRFPNLRADAVVFAACDDIWLVNLSATEVDSGPARAHRLTADQVPVSRPRLSADGLSVAWVSRRSGEPEVFAMAVAGGPVTQLTFFGSATTAIQGFMPDGRLVVTSATAQPFRSRTWAYAIELVTGGPAPLPVRLPFGPVNGVAFADGGAVVVGTGYTRDPAHWKRYRGGTAGRLWLSPGLEPDAQSATYGQFTEMLAELVGPKTAPVWLSDRLAFLADFEGFGNVYSVAADGSDLRRHTDHGQFYARQLSGDGDRLVYSHAGQLWLLDDLDADSQPRQLDIVLPGDRPGRAVVELEAAEHIGDFTVDATGRASVVEVRGSVHWFTHRDGPARVVAAEAGVRYRLPVALSGTYGSVACVCDADGPDAIEVITPTGRARFGSGAIGRVLELVASPDGQTLALATHDGRVLLLDLEGQFTEVETNPSGDATGLSFSPDSGWLAYSAAEPSRLRSIRLFDIASSVRTSVTTERFVDTEPVFSLDSKYLMFLSARTFDPVYDAHVFDLSFPLATRPYLVTLAADTVSPFDAELDGRDTKAEQQSSAGDGGRHAEAPGDKPASVEPTGMTARVVPFPVSAGRLSALRAVQGGVVWTDTPISGVLGEARLPDDEIRPSLQRWDFATRTQSELASALDGFDVSGDGLKLVVRDKDALRVVPSEHKPAEDGHESVDIDLARIRLRVDPPAEWAQMIAEAGRLMRDHFWIADMADVDWDGAVARWQALTARIATRDDLSDVLWELNGETGSSHAYETPPPVPIQPWHKPAFLGADLARTGAGWVIERVLSGDSSAREARSPLTAPGSGIVAGDVIVAVNGVSVGPGGPGELLRGTAGKPIAVTIDRAGSQRTAVVLPLANETTLRYLDWVASRRAAVREAGGGRIGYVHVPDMMSAGWAALHRDLRVEMGRDALIVDTRDNAGGHTSQLVIEKLSRRVIGWDIARHLPTSTYPEDAPRGPIVSIANEWSGSDGDIVNAAFKALELGPVLGVRTWGGVVGIDGRYSLIDGTAVTQPRYAFWFSKFGWTVENHGVDPDQVVEFAPQDWAAEAENGASSDPQLRAAVAYLLSELDSQTPPQLPEPASRPSLRPPELPPRRAVATSS